MTHRNKDLVMIMGDESQDIVEQSSTVLNRGKRRSTRLEKKNNAEPAENLIIADLESTDTDNELRKRLKRKRSVFDDIIEKYSRIDDIDVDDEDDIYDSDESVQDFLMKEQWFNKLSTKQQNKYLKIFTNTVEGDENNFTVKDILDLDISRHDKKYLLSEYSRIQSIDKLQVTYDIEKKNLFDKLKTFKQSANIEYELLMNADEKVSLKDRIINMQIDDKTKQLIYKKYLYYQSLDNESGEKSKIEKWLDYAIRIPVSSKQIVLSTEIPRNLAINKIILELYSKLDEKVYGLNSIKIEIISMISSILSNPVSKMKSFGLSGPPGVGKTLIASILGDVLNMPLEVIALGGCKDSTYLEGEIMSYIGASPGIIYRSMVKMQQTNAIFFFDELDKISKKENSDIAQSLLHVTDFTLNNKFRDKYMDEIYLDLSNCVFIFSMNDADKLDPALRSRIPIYHVEGYDRDEKLTIINKYLLPEIIKNYSIKMSDIIFSDNILKQIVAITAVDEINGKSGIRELKNCLNIIINRINTYYVANVNGSIGINLDFGIENFKLPYTVEQKLFDNVIGKMNLSSQISVPYGMYI